MEIKLRGFSFSFDSIALVQKANPQLWIIDTAPLFLGIFAAIAGVRKQKLLEQAIHLENLVETRSSDVLRQKLFYEALVQNNPIAVVTLDKNHQILSINPAFQELFGFPQSEIMDKQLDGLIANPVDPKEAISLTEQVLSGKSIHEFGSRKRKDGSFVDVEIFGEPIMVNGNLIGVLGLYRDITLEKTARESLVSSEERFRRMFTDSPIALRMEDFSIVKTWIDGKSESIRANLIDHLTNQPEEFEKLCSFIKIVDLNDASLQLFGARSREELQKNLYGILSKDTIKEAIDIVGKLYEGITSIKTEMVYSRLNGEKVYTITKLSVMPGFENSWERILFSNMDITDRKLSEERLTYISLHDIMTAIYNRAFFEEEMSRFEKSRIRPVSILVMDMDNLKNINDQYGHQQGDNALQVIADILRSCFRSEDVVARIGGDEFAVLLPNVSEEQAKKAINRIQNGITLYNKTPGRELVLSMSIGYATAEKDESLGQAFTIADEAMYREKNSRKNRG